MSCTPETPGKSSVQSTASIKAVATAGTASANKIITAIMWPNVVPATAVN
uniref:Ash family protein n=1 Tax=Macrostomum lignano TaxID=282301 RepID=A0A1I8I5D8_9PLAT